jgi:hypothetical protein
VKGSINISTINPYPTSVGKSIFECVAGAKFPVILQLKSGGNKMNQTCIHQLILSITLVIGMFFTSSACSQEVENLLMDGGFEEAVLGWGLATRAPAAATLTIDTEEKRVGQASARIEITDVGDGSSNHNLTLDNQAGIAVTANKTYTVDFWTKAEADRTLIIDALQNQDPWARLFRVTDLPVTTEWTRIHHTFQADATMSPVVFLFSFVDSKTTIWLDHVRFYEGEFDEEDGVPESAFDPDPEDGTVVEATWANLSWRPGNFALTHDVYFGESFDAVNEGAEGTFVGSQSAAFSVVGFPGFPYPDGLVPGTTYYWRVDEVNDTDPNSPWKGDVWSFSISPKTAYFPDPADGAEAVAVNDKLSWTPGFGAKLHTVYFGESFNEVDSATGGLPQGTTDFTPGTLKMAKTYYWRVDEFDVLDTHKGDVWSFTTEGAVAILNPANRAVDVTQMPVLTWAPGFGASHEIYFGTNAASLELKGSGNLGSESYEPGQLDWNTTYYWRVDEANNANADSPWTGPLWSFTTANFLIIDDMESYNDLDEGEPGSNRIYLAWLDGFDNPAVNGSVVGYSNPPFAEQSIVHGGSQSMPFAYDNAVGKSEATLTLTSNNDWTVNGVNKLTIWYRGDSGNAAETMYVMLNGSAAVDNDDPAAAQVGTWTEWNVDLQAFADQGVNLANVNSITLGLSSVSGGTGIMYFDNIRLYPQ